MPEGLTDVPAARVPDVLLPEGETLFIGGRWRDAGATYERFDPSALERPTGTYAMASGDDVAEAFAAAARAQAEWAATPAPRRGDVLHRAADLLAQRVEAAAARLTADMGKALRDARAEVMRSAAILRYFAGELLQPMGDTYASADPAVFLLTVEEPVGVVCAITPWNFPFAIPTWKLAPAIGFGNAVVWKPADAASGSAVFLAQTFEAAGLPAGILNLVTGKGSAMSPHLTGSPALNALTFTGSGGVGARLRQAVADRNVKVQLELGGKNPAIVLADADLADAAGEVARSAMTCTGQRCTATSRVYVERSVADEFLSLLAKAVSALAVGDPYRESTDLGPLASMDQYRTVSEYVELAHRENADVLALGAGGDLPPCYYPPTVLTGLARDSRVVREEIFGPVALVEEVADFDEALRAANDTEFGLSSAVFTSSIDKALAFVRATRSGLVHVNRDTAGVELHVPFGGLKGSSNMAREQGKAARIFFTNTKTAYLRSPSVARAARLPQSAPAAGTSVAPDHRADVSRLDPPPTP